jgi:RND family efflux transporter MFP subunit
MKIWGSLLAGVLVVALGAAGGAYYVTHRPGTSTAAPHPAGESGQPYIPEDNDPSDPPAVQNVQVIRPQKGMDYEVEQPGSVHAFESVQLRANVSGFLKTQNVDIGDRVKKGQVLAVIDVPELQKQLQHHTASLERTRARVAEMEARVVSARADHEAAKAAVEQADAAFKSASAWVRFRGKQYQRMKDLFGSQSIEERLVDESKERYEASLETERSAKAAIATSTANLAASAAKIQQTQADVAGAKSEVKVAQAELEKTQVLLDFATIVAPFDGEVTRRNYFPGDFIRSASDGANQEPLLTVQRTDKFRVVVQVPDTAVPYLNKGDPATVRIDTLPGRKFEAKVSRIAGSEDPNTRLMRVEVDLPNPTGEISDGMYGKVRILLDRFPNRLSLPVGCLLKTGEGRWAVYVVRDGHASLTPVQRGKDNGTRVVILGGLRPDDQVVLDAGTAGLVHGAEVNAQLVRESAGPVEQEER